VVSKKFLLDRYFLRQTSPQTLLYSIRGSKVIRRKLSGHSPRSLSTATPHTIHSTSTPQTVTHLTDTILTNTSLTGNPLRQILHRSSTTYKSQVSLKSDVFSDKVWQTPSQTDTLRHKLFRRKLPCRSPHTDSLISSTISSPKPLPKATLSAEIYQHGKPRRCSRQREFVWTSLPCSTESITLRSSSSLCA
jgi:hypothetical protein